MLRGWVEVTGFAVRGSRTSILIIIWNQLSPSRLAARHLLPGFPASSNKFLLLSLCFTATETIRLITWTYVGPWLIRHGRLEVVEEVDYIPIATLPPPE